MLKRIMIVAAVVVGLAAQAQGQGQGPGRGAGQQKMKMKMMHEQGAFRNKAPQEVRTAIQDIADQYQKAWGSHDAKKISSMFTEDATYVGSMGQVATGRDQIQQVVTQEHQGPLAKSSVEIEVRSVRLLSPDTAVVDSHATISGAAAQMPSNLHVTTLAHKQQGEWKIAALRAFPMPQPGMGVGGAGLEPMEPMEQQPMEPMEPMWPPAEEPAPIE